MGIGRDRIRDGNAVAAERLDLISDHTPKPSGSSRYSSRSGLTTEAGGADHCTAAVIASGSVARVSGEVP